MQDFEAQGGIAFLILMYTSRNEFYLMPFSELLVYWNRMQDGGRKSFTYEEFEKRYPLKAKGEYLCHYLEGLSEWLTDREEEKRLKDSKAL